MSSRYNPYKKHAGRGVPSREAQVLERQRQMADRLSGIRSVAPADGAPQKAKPPPPPVAGGAGKMAGGKRSLASLMGGKSSSKAISAPATSFGTTVTKGSADATPGSTSAAAAGHQREILYKQARREELKRIFGNKEGDESGGKASTQKRPSSFKRPAPRANTAQAALAQARQRATKQPISSSETAASAASEESTGDGNSQKLKRAPLRRNRVALPAGHTGKSDSAQAPSGGEGRSMLASLLLSNTDTAKFLQPNAPKLLKHYPKIEPNDYWKNMRDWDFLGDLNDRMKAQKRGGNNNGKNRRKNARNGDDEDRKRKRIEGNDESSSNTNQNGDEEQDSITTNTRPPLPDTFQSYRQYCALWAPLCLEEARAQLLSEAITEIPYWRKPDKAPVIVNLQPFKKDLEGTSDNIGVQIKKVLSSSSYGGGGRGGSGGGGGGREMPYMANDVILLAKEESHIWAASKGTLGVNNNHQLPTSKEPLGLIGHIESTRRSLEGLILQVSRNIWSQIGTSEMVLIRIGSNVTALREFTALCRMDRIPLLDYILGEKMTPSTSLSTNESADNKSNSTYDDELTPNELEKQKKKEILSNMGGSSVLGKGFAEHARNKFNPSQLGAIAASAQDYGGGGFTLIKGPPGTGKTTTLCALLNALHIRQMNQFYQDVRSHAESYDAVVGKRAALSLADANKKRPRILVCAPSNAAVDNVIMKIMEEGFVGGDGNRYNPSIVRVGVGQSASVKDVCLEEKVEGYLSDATDINKLENTIEGFKAECRRIHADISKLRYRMNAIKTAAPYPLSKEWEIRVDEDTFDTKPRVYFVNHKDKSTTYEVPPPPEPGERHFPARAMPEYKTFVGKVVKLVERYNTINTKVERYQLCQNAAAALSKGGKNNKSLGSIRDDLETHILDSVHIVMTTLGTAGNRALEAASKFEVVVIDEAAQSVEPSTLAGLQLGSSHAILVGDPQQLPATIFSVSGKSTKYDRSLFQRLEEAGHEVHMLNTQYRMHPAISDFPRRIFYDGKLMDGSNVKHPEYGNPLKHAVFKTFQAFQSFTVLDLESSEERGGTSLANTAEAQLALHLYNNLKSGTNGLSTKSRVAVITPYSQQAALLRRTFSNSLGAAYERFVEVNTVDAFQGREANIVIFSCVRAAGSRGIGFLSDVRRMNVALTRAKFFLFVLARCSSIVVNPYWRDLVEHARETEAIIRVPVHGSRRSSFSFPDLSKLKAVPPPPKPIISVMKKIKMEKNEGSASSEEGEIS